MDSNILTIALWIGFPYLLSYFTKRKSQNPLKIKPPQKSESYITFFLCIFLLMNVIFLYQIPRNFLEELNIKIESPTYILRNSFREYMVAQFPGWTEGSPLYFFSDDERKSIQAYEALYDKLKINANRKVYLVSGHVAFEQCTWCKEPFDYSLYILPGVLFSYLLTAISIGVASSLRKKRFWRVYGVGYIFLIAVFDSVILFTDFKSEISSSLENPFNDMYRIRHIAWIFLGVLVLFLNTKDVYTEVDILEDILKKQHYLNNRIQAYRLGMAACLGTTELRRQYMKYYSEKQAFADAILRNVEFKEIKAKTLVKYNLEEMLSSVNQMMAAAQVCEQKSYSSKMDTMEIFQVDDLEEDVSVAPETTIHDSRYTKLPAKQSGLTKRK